MPKSLLTAALIAMALTGAVLAADAPDLPKAPDVPFASIDGGAIRLADYAGKPVLIANTASMCSYTPQYDALQALQDTYAEQGLVVLAVPSDDFRQELADAGAVKEFCAINFDLTLPMTDITHVRGAQAHPVFAWVREQTGGWEPAWNFNKVLIGPDGRVLDTWGSGADPMGRDIRTAVEAALE